MKMIMVAATAAMLCAGPALAQNNAENYRWDYGTQGPASDDDLNPSLRSEPPGGSYQGYFESRDLPQQTAEVPSNKPKPHPGTLKKFNSNSGYGPEVEFDVERREAQAQKKWH